MKNKHNSPNYIKSFLKDNGVSIIVIFFGLLYAFNGLWYTFYQQDEWLAVGSVYEQGIKYPFYGFNFLQVIFGDGRPLTRIFSYYFFSNLPFNFTALAIYSIGFHFANSILVYFIAKRVLGNRVYGFTASIFFALNSVPAQSVTWFAASFGLQPASFLVLVSLYSFIKFVDTQKKSYAWISMLSCVVSLYFKESGIFLFLFYPIVPFILNSKVSVKKYLINFSPIFLYAALFALFRISIMIARSKDSLLAGTTLLNQGSMVTPVMILLRVVMYPLTSFSLMFVDPPIPRAIAMWFIRKYYPFITVQGDLVAYTVVLDMLSLISSVLLLSFFFSLTWKNEQDKRSLLFSLFLILTSILPFVVVSKEYTYLEPRYYYIPVIGAAIIFGLIVKKIHEFTQRISSMKYIIAILVALFMFLHVNTIHEEVAMQQELAKTRQSYISQLEHILPTLTENLNIFFVAGDQAYVFDGNYTPFQNGFGYSLMVIYRESSRIPKGLLTSGYFFNFEHGYREVDGKGFGYYMDVDELKKDALKYKFPENSIHGLYYNSKTEKVIDISGQTRKLIFEVKEVKNSSF